jgi:hypothetical protein
LHFLRHDADIGFGAAIINEAIKANAAIETAEQRHVVLKPKVGPPSATAATAAARSSATTATATAARNPAAATTSNTAAAAAAETRPAAPGFDIGCSPGADIA